MLLTSVIPTYKTRINQYLTTQFDQLNDVSPTLLAAMQHAVFPGGKRLRPLLVYFTGHALGVRDEALDAPAGAIELIHCYSLVHDDLPAMDNASMRHGQPACHVAYDEATAILVGDALQAYAFELLSTPLAAYRTDEQNRDMLLALAKTCGPAGMAAGQMLDLTLSDSQLTEEALKTCYQLKTGQLINASIQLGAIASPNLSEGTLEKLHQYSTLLGLAFQIQDDLLDVTASTQELGKPQGQDKIQHKPTFLDLYSLNEVQNKINALYIQAKDILTDLKLHNSKLYDLTGYLHKRSY